MNDDPVIPPALAELLSTTRRVGTEAEVAAAALAALSEARQAASNPDLKRAPGNRAERRAAARRAK